MDRWYRGELITGPNYAGMYSVTFDVPGGGQQYSADTLAGIKEIIRDKKAGRTSDPHWKHDNTPNERIIMAMSPDVSRKIRQRYTPTHVDAFEAWLNRLDAVLLRHIGLTHRDIADRPYRNAFDDGVPPSEVAIEILEEEIDTL